MSYGRCGCLVKTLACVALSALHQVVASKVDSKDPDAVQGLFGSARHISVCEATLAALLPFRALVKGTVMDRTMANVTAATGGAAHPTSAACFCHHISGMFLPSHQWHV